MEQVPATNTSTAMVVESQFSPEAEWQQVIPEAEWQRSCYDSDDSFDEKYYTSEQSYYDTDDEYFDEEYNTRGRKIGIHNDKPEFEVDELGHGPFKVTYDKHCDRPWPEVVNVTMSSTPLKKILERYFPDILDRYIKSEVKGRDLYRVLQSLKNYVAESNGKSSRTEEEESGALHLQQLVRFVETEYNNVSVRDRRMKEEKRAPWDMLWTLLSKGTKVGYYCKYSGELLCGVVASSTYNSCHSHVRPCCGIVLDVWNFDGVQYKACKIKRHIVEYQGEHDFAQLPVLPVEFLGDPSRLDAEFFAKGKRFYELAVATTNRFMHYEGMMCKEEYKELCKERSDGRVMIDFTSFAKMNPSSSSYIESKELQLHDSPTCWIDGRPVYKPIEVSNESLIFAPAIVYGFSFALKEWGSFAVSGFSDITFNTGAFDELILDPSMKHSVHDLVSLYICPSTDERYSSGSVSSVAAQMQKDPISRNEKNTVFLCYGAPGTGKTLTAESIAEKMMRPVWALNALELGADEYDSKKLESNLKKVFRIATKWQAVLLLDEAHVLLGKQWTCNEISPKFFRLLECYWGVLFLATNRIRKVDVKCRSQITLLLHYPSLSEKNRTDIWNAVLTRMNVKGLSIKFCEEMATKELNGHDIKNAIHMAQVFARSNKEALAISHVKYVTETLGNSVKTFTEKIDKKYT